MFGDHTALGGVPSITKRPFNVAQSAATAPLAQTIPAVTIKLVEQSLRIITWSLLVEPAA